MTDRQAVSDWAADFDHMDARWVEDPYSIWDDLRQRCPVAHTERYGGVYLPTRMADIRDVAYDTETFSNRRPVVRANPPQVALPTPPISSDPPHHKPSRMLLLPAFTPQAIAPYIPVTRRICNELLDKIGNAPTCDAARDYAQHVPVRVIASMLGVPETDGDLFRAWIHVMLEDTVRDSPDSAEKFVAVSREMDSYFRSHVEKRASHDGPDLISFMMRARFDGRELTERHFYGTLRLLLIAGIDTTWSAIGSSLWHLARTPGDRRRLVAEPDLIPTAVEEFLRAYSPVTMARQVRKDGEIAGCPVKAGEMVLLAFPAANRDPAVFPDADKVIIDRQDNRHAAFGLGIHRCAGSNLARMEMQVALEEWLKRIPDFTLDESLPVAWSSGQVRGPRAVPIKIGSGAP
ncbi:MAG TPA: cytochrome P450 [Hyphomicrobiaceae bacterium]|nr:cytochrome P450 [Hyphomicrobiaceae bacterium]